MGRLSIDLLGGFRARLGSGHPVVLARRKAQAVLARLAVRPGHPLPRESLIGLLWSESPEEQARHSLRQALLELRHALAAARPDPLLVEGDTIGLDAGRVDVDVIAFEHLATTRTPKALGEAARLYEGDFLSGFAVREAPFEEWLGAERERLRELALETLRRLLAQQTAQGPLDAAVQTALRLLALDPLQEVAHRALMRLYERQDRRSAALRQYQLCVETLRRELGVDPEEETRQLYRELLPQRTAPALTAGVPGRDERVRAITPPTADAPLVGREAELERLRQAFAEARNGRGQIVVVSGEAGIGKSRLIQELVATVAQTSGQILIGRCYDMTQILAFGPWVDALRSGTLTADPALLTGLDGVWRAELARLLPEIGVEEARPSGTDDHLQLFEAVARLVDHLANRSPLMVALEDLHWGDEMSLRLLSFLGHRLRTTAALLVGTLRDEDLGDNPWAPRMLDDLDREPRFVRLGLTPLSKRGAMTLARALARTRGRSRQADRVAEQVWQATGGNPFVIVETVRALRDEPVTDRVELPGKVREVIAARLARLGDAGRQVVAIAAVIGRDFEFALVQHAAGLGEREAAAAVEELVRRRVMHDVGSRFDFVHDRVREVAYGQLGLSQRRLLHRLAGEAVEERYAEDLEPYVAALGTHYREGEVWDKAFTYLRRAGAQAAARSAYREAAVFFEGALEALQHLPPGRDVAEKAVDVRLDLRTALVPLNEDVRILEHLTQARPLAEALDDPHRLAAIHMYLTRAYFVLGDPDRALQAGRRALTLGRRLHHDDLRVSSRLFLGEIHHALGDLPTAIELLSANVEALTGEREYAHCGMTGLPSVFSRWFLAWSLAELGRFAEAHRLAAEGLRIAETAAQPLSLTAAAQAAGMVSMLEGDVAAAIRPLERGLHIARSRNLRLHSGGIAVELGYAYARAGRIDEGLALLESTVKPESTPDFERRAVRWLRRLGEAYLLVERLDEAAACAEQSLALARKARRRAGEAWALRLQGEVASLRGPDVVSAEHRYEEALALAGELGLRPLAALCHLGRGRLLRAHGRAKEARDALTTAAAELEAMAMTSWLAQAEAERLPLTFVDPADDPRKN